MTINTLHPGRAWQPRPPLLRTVGPGIVFALTVLGPGDFVANAVTGAAHGYSLLWALALAVVFRFVWLDASARYVLATGETLMDGYRRLSPVLVWATLGAMVLIRSLSNLYKLVLLGNTAQLLLPLPFAGARYAWAGACSFLAFLICSRGKYPLLERLFKLLVAVLCAALVAAVALARPEPRAMLAGLWPSLPADRGDHATLYLLLALIGTEAGSMTNVTYSYFMGQKGWRSPEFRPRQLRDLLLSVTCLFAMGAFVQITAAATLHPAGLAPQGAEELVRLFTGTLGRAGLVIFTFGLSAAAVSGFIGGTTGYSLVAADIWSKLGAGGGQAPDALYRRFAAFWCFAPLPLVYAAGRPVWLVLAVSAWMGVLIPVLAVALLRLGADSKRMGGLRAPWPLRCALVALTAVAAALVISNAALWWTGWKAAA